MSRILFIIESDFWNNSKGISTRFNQVYDEFKNYERFILYIGKLNKNTKNLIMKRYGNNIKSLYPVKRKIYAIIRKIFNKLKITIPNFMYNPINQSFIIRKKVNKIIKKNRIDVCWLYYIWNYDVLSYDSKCLKIIDTQDIASEIVINKRKNNIFFPSNLTFDEEVNILKKFDLVLAISKRDYISYYQYLKSNVYYLPFYFESKKIKEISKKDEILIGFIGGNADFNIIAANRIINDILPLCKTKFKMYFFGTIAKHIHNNFNNNIVLYGPVEHVSDAYEIMDISINPATMGSGLKTKCIEAMSYGIPLITTSIGAQGIEEGINKVFLLAETDLEFASAIDKLVLDINLRRELSNEGLKYISSKFGEGNYNNLKQILKERICENGKKN
jgi:glycosyltransferase, family 1